MRERELHALPFGQTSSDGRRQGAARAVNIQAMNARAFEDLDVLISTEVHVHHHLSW